MNFVSPKRLGPGNWMAKLYDELGDSFPIKPPFGNVSRRARDSTWNQTRVSNRPGFNTKRMMDNGKAENESERLIHRKEAGVKAIGERPSRTKEIL